jgi:hypothetical protein
MNASLTNPPVPLALHIDLLKFRNPRLPPIPELIFKLHKIIAKPESRAEEVKIAKRALLAAIEQSKHFSQAGISPSLKKSGSKIPRQRLRDAAIVNLQDMP